MKYIQYWRITAENIKTREKIYATVGGSLERVTARAKRVYPKNKFLIKKSPLYGYDGAMAKIADELGVEVGDLDDF